MSEAGRSFRVIETSTPQEATEAAREASATSRVVVAAGGDGSLHYVAAGVIEARLVGAEAVLGVLPIGTGNDFARMVGMPEDPEAGLETLLEAETTAVDHGWAIWDAGGVSVRRPFVNCAGIGLDAESAGLASRLKRFVGNAAYVLAPAIAVLRWRAPQSEVFVSTDAKQPAELWSGALMMASVANGRWIGGGIHIAPSARADDHLLDLCLIPELSILRGYRLLSQAVSGKHVGRPEVILRQFARLEVSTSAPLPVYVDGEPGARAVRHVVFEAAAGELPMLVGPKQSTSDPVTTA